MRCCEFVENGYIDCKRCYEHKKIIKELNGNTLFEKFSKGEKLSIKEIEILKKEVINIKQKLNII